MRRLFVCLPLCLALAPNTQPEAAAPLGETALAHVLDKGGPLPSAADMERLAKADPVAFLEWCLVRHEREVKGYHAKLVKQERIGGKLQPREFIDVDFREQPFSVRLQWPKAPRPALWTLYVKGANDDKLVVLPEGIKGALGPISLDPKGSMARESTRYLLTEFGIKVGCERTLAAWKAAREAKHLHVKYLGKLPNKELGPGLYYVFERSPYAKPEEDGIAYMKTYVDAETWMQVGTVLKNDKGDLIGEYLFKEVQLNPKFKDDLFTRAGQKK
jgi:hypothetical protein